jgi:hypothetical protein
MRPDCRIANGVSPIDEPFLIFGIDFFQPGGSMRELERPVFGAINRIVLSEILDDFSDRYAYVRAVFPLNLRPEHGILHHFFFEEYTVSDSAPV